MKTYFNNHHVRLNCLIPFFLTFKLGISGQPRRHLLQSGWSVFVSSKRLVAGDAFIFLRFDASLICHGISIFNYHGWQNFAERVIYFICLCFGQNGNNVYLLIGVRMENCVLVLGEP